MVAGNLTFLVRFSWYWYKWRILMWLASNLQ